MSRSWLLLLYFTFASPSLIPRETLISSADNIASSSVSPDGKFIGYIARDENKVRNVFTLRSADLQKRQLTFEKRDVLKFAWTGVENLILFEEDNHGDENNMIFKMNISEKAETNVPTVVYNVRGVRAIILGDTTKKDYVLIALNNDVPSYHNVYKFDLYTNELTLVFLNNRFDIDHIAVDHDLKIRMAKKDQEDGSTVFYRVSESANTDILSSDQWEEYVRVEPDDVPLTKYFKFDKSNENAYFLLGEGTDLGSLVIASCMNFTDRTVLYSAKKAELEKPLFHPVEHTILALTEKYHKSEVVFVNETVKDDMSYLADFRPEGSLLVLSISDDLNIWIVTYLSSLNAREIYIYRRPLKSIELLFKTNRELEKYALSKQIGFDFVARDGLTIQGYLSLPPNAQLKQPEDVRDEDKQLAEQGMIPEHPQKMVLRVHGGPNSRDYYDFNMRNAFMTSRGYAVMEVNFRGSTGFGKKLLNAGNGEWSRKMHYDLLDAVEFAVEKGIANRSAVAIMGSSYGGYATLVGLTFTPDVFACGIDLYGPTNLVSLLETMPPYWREYREELKKASGDIQTEEGRQELIARSPLFLAHQVKGGNDARVKQSEPEQFVQALQNHSIPYTFAVFPDEGHGFRRIPNLLAQTGLVDKFLYECLGGDYQPFTSGQYNESAIVKSYGVESNKTDLIIDSSSNYKFGGSISVIIFVLPVLFVL